jgi:hypothetical protein
MTLVIRSSETSVLIRASWRHIPQDGILHPFSLPEIELRHLGRPAHNLIALPIQLTRLIFKDASVLVGQKYLNQLPRV